MQTMTLDPLQILPSQEYLKPKTLRYIFACMEKEQFEKLPPDPVVRKDAENNYIAIDGHNIIAVYLHKKIPIDVFVSESKEDRVPENVEGSKIRNKELCEKFDTAPGENKRIKSLGINSFNDLLKLYPELFS